MRDPQRIGAWIETTARRESLRVLRNGKRERPTASEEFAPEPVDPVAEQRLIAAADRAAVRRALDRLPRRHRRLRPALRRRPAQLEEISRTLDMPLGSLGPTRARGLARLRGDQRFVAAVRGVAE